MRSLAAHAGILRAFAPGRASALPAGAVEGGVEAAADRRLAAGLAILWPTRSVT